MKLHRRLFAIAFGILCLASLAAWQAAPVIPALASSSTPAATGAAPTQTDGPQRKAKLQVPFTSYDWWVNSWHNNQVLCELWIEHDGMPKDYEISSYCDAPIYSLWSQSKPCPQAESGGNVQACTGAYLHLVGSQESSREVTVDLAPPTVWVSVSGCELLPPENKCDSLPSLQFTAEEPLPNENIIDIQGKISDTPFSCQGADCTIPIPPTGEQGTTVEFWADSTYGDSSQHFTAQVRAVPWGDFMAPESATTTTAETQQWYVDVISTQWKGAPLASCSEIWDSFPDLGGPPQWLTTPDRVEDLSSNQSLYYLAGVLIQNKDVDASGCQDGGLASPGLASECGLQTAMPKLQDWQNQFDGEIIQVAKDTGVPAQLMKNIFSRESQFWPGIYQTFREAGLGQLTENGAETTLLWNPDFFNQFCPLVFQKDVCGYGWSKLTPEHQDLLKGALVNKVNAACPDCPSGIDLSRAKFSVNVFAETLRANCQQAGQIVHNVTNKSAGASSRYADLWVFTLVNYNAGPGCLAHAVNQTHLKNEPLDWPHVAQQLDGACQGAIQYVNAVTSEMPPDVALTATAQAPTAVPPVLIPTQPIQITPTLANATPTQRPNVLTVTPVPTRPFQPTPTSPGGYPPPIPYEPTTPSGPGYP